MSVAGINVKLFSAFVEINENVIDKINVVIKTVIFICFIYFCSIPSNYYFRW